MKKLGVLLSVVFVAVFFLAAPAKAAPKSAGKTHSMTAEVVSADANAKTITIKDANGDTKTAPVLGNAVAKLKTLKAGDKVDLTCQDNEKGEHQGVSGINLAKKQ